MRRPSGPGPVRLLQSRLQPPTSARLAACASNPVSAACSTPLVGEVGGVAAVSRSGRRDRPAECDLACEKLRPRCGHDPLHGWLRAAAIAPDGAHVDRRHDLVAEHHIENALTRGRTECYVL